MSYCNNLLGRYIRCIRPIQATIMRLGELGEYYGDLSIGKHLQ